MIEMPVIFEMEFLHEFQERFGKDRGMLLCLVYQIYLDSNWQFIKTLLPNTSAWRAKKELSEAGYIRGAE
ncbi:MAG: hypothetical protein ACYTEW_27130 [Planctomycetota bacterium]|jgi:hypothetical protein